MMGADRIWTVWNWREDPEAPRRWTDPARRVVLVEGTHEAIRLREDAVVPAMMAVEEAARNAVYIAIEPVAALLDMQANYSALRAGWPRRLIPALRQERLGGITTDDLRALCRCSTRHKAIVASPRERFPIGLDGTIPRDWNLGYRPVGDLVDLVVVQEPRGPGAWPVSKSWVRELRDECIWKPIVDGGTAFAYLGGGCASGVGCGIAGCAFCSISPDRALYESLVEQGALETLLDGRKHLDLPEGL